MLFHSFFVLQRYKFFLEQQLFLSQIDSAEGLRMIRCILILYERGIGGRMAFLPSIRRSGSAVAAKSRTAAGIGTETNEIAEIATGWEGA